MRNFRFLVILILIGITTNITAANTEIKSTDSYYTYPILDVARLYSAAFGEMRPNHFHSGIDIKSDGTSGKKIVAAADGYISRISYSPYGYGLALYIVHPNKTTTVYGHLSRYRDDIAKYVTAERYRLKQHSVNIFLTPSQFPVKKGDLVAFSGNTGASSAPHLHFEIRDKDQRPINPVTTGVIRPADNTPPIITNIYYIETKTINGVSHERKIAKYDVERNSIGQYQLTKGRNIWVGREGYFVIGVTDRKTNVLNKFGIYNLRGYIGDELFYEYKQDGFSFTQTRYCNAISYYPLQRSSVTEYYRMKRVENLPIAMLKHTKDYGILRTKAGEQNTITIEATDDMGNTSTITFSTKGKDDADCLDVDISPTTRIAHAMERSLFTDEDITVSIPSGALYESKIYDAKEQSNTPTFNQDVTGVNIHSPIYSVMDYDTPLHRAMKISIKCDIPETLQEHATAVYINSKGDYSPIVGKYDDGCYTFTSSSAGSFFVASHKIAPTITANFADGADLKAKKSITLKLKDNFSGINSYEATIDGKWVALDIKGMMLTHHFTAEPTGDTHTLEVTVSDNCKNINTIRLSFKR